jgi:hypothetical protein
MNNTRFGVQVARVDEVLVGVVRQVIYDLPKAVSQLPGKSLYSRSLLEDRVDNFLHTNVSSITGSRTLLGYFSTNGSVETSRVLACLYTLVNRGVQDVIPKEFLKPHFWPFSNSPDAYRVVSFTGNTTQLSYIELQLVSLLLYFWVEHIIHMSTGSYYIH